MAKKKRRKAGKRSPDSLPGWIYMFMGLAIGLAVAAGIYVSDRRQPVGTLTQSSAPAVPEPAPSQPEPAAPEPQAGISFDFYDMLPNLDVEVFEAARPPTRATPPPARVETPGIYILQAGSFSQLGDADRRKAEISLLGVRSEIKKGSANGRTVYRVYTDPMQNPDEVNTVSSQLTGAGIEILLKRVSD
jgi:cell division protein FtsN